MIVSHEFYIWFITIAAAAVCAGVGAFDLVVLRRYRRSTAPEHRDRVFGALTGLVVAAVGFVGMIKYHCF